MKKPLMTLIFLLIMTASVHAKELITIKDMADRDVRIPKNVQRIVALSASLRYIVYLQAFDKVVGIEGVEKQRVMRGNPATGKAYWLAIKDKVHDIESVGEGGPGKLPDFERLISVRPDIVITFEVDNAQLIQNKTGIPTVVVNYAGTEGFRIEDIQKAFSFLGTLLGRENRAEELNRYLQQMISDLERRTKGQRKTYVYIGAISARGAHGITSSEANYPPLKWLGVNNVVDETGKKGHVFIDREKLLQWDPEYIFIDTGGINMVNQDYNRQKEFYKMLKAVNKGRVNTIMPFNFYRTNLELLMSNAYFIGKTVYPDRFKDIDIEQKTRDILKMFLSVDVYDDLRSSFKGYERVKFTNSGITTE